MQVDEVIKIVHLVLDVEDLLCTIIVNFAHVEVGLNRSLVYLALHLGLSIVTCMTVFGLDLVKLVL